MRRIVYDYKEAAEMLGGMTVQALRDLRHKGDAPVATRCGNRVYFRHEDLVDWALAHREVRLPDPPLSQTAAINSTTRGRPTVKQRQADLRRK